MPNKTLYVRESDLALWELIQTQLGLNMSALFAEFLRERIQTMNVFVHVLRSAPNSQDLAVSFAPVGPSGSGGSLKLHYIQEQQLIDFLEKHGVAPTVAAKIASDLQGARSVSELTAIRQVAVNV